MGEPETERHGLAVPAGWWISNPFQGEYNLAPVGGTPRWTVHPGIDIISPDGKCDWPVYAAQGGFVTYSALAPGSWGNVVLIEHRNGLWTQYAHLKGATVTKGTFVARGQQIGTVGSAEGRFACHLHFEIRKVDLPADHWPGVAGVSIAAQHAEIARCYVNPVGVLGA